MKSHVRTATEVDAFVGSQLKSLRKSAGYSQTELANKVGVTFQQIQKYARDKPYRCQPALGVL